MAKKKKPVYYDHISRAPFMQPILDKMHAQQKAWKDAIEHNFPDEEVDKPTKAE